MFMANMADRTSRGPRSGLLFHLLSGGEHELQGFYGHVMGGMGSITQALAAAGKKLGVEIRTSASVAQIDVRNGRARSVVLEDGTELRATDDSFERRSEADISGNGGREGSAGRFLFAVRGIKMQGPCAKVNMVLAEEPRFTGTSPQADAAGAHVLHAGSVAGICRALLRHREVRRYS